MVLSLLRELLNKVLYCILSVSDDNWNMIFEIGFRNFWLNFLTVWICDKTKAYRTRQHFDSVPCFILNILLQIIKGFLVSKATLELLGQGPSVSHTFQFHHYDVISESHITSLWHHICLIDIHESTNPKFLRQ